jgi:arylsulfatase A-like enzyme
MLLSPAADTPRKPNVVIILADDLGWADLGCYGSKFHRTPNIDRMAKEGVRFTNFYAACPVCSPTRAALMTGKHPARLGITDWLPGRPDRADQALARPKLVNALPLEEMTLATRFKKAGYATAHVGKWHLGGEGFGPLKHGFDLNIAGDHTGTPRSYFAPFTGMPGLEKAKEGEYLTDRLTDEAVKFIDANKAKPFFLYLAHYGVHIPMKAKADLAKKYPAGVALGKQGNNIYAAMLESVDESVGRVLKRLKELMLDKDTIVVFTSDNGGLATREGPNTPPTFNGPLREGKGFLYEGGIRVPLIMWHPGKIRPGEAPTPAITQDLVPTLLDACGIDRGKDRLDGHSLSYDLKRMSVAPRTQFWHYPHYSNQGGKPGGAIRHREWKLIEFYEDGRRELYNLKDDPGEHRNLAAEKPDVVKDLAAKLAAWRKEVGAKMPTANPKYLPNPQTDKGFVLHARTARVHGAQLRYEPPPHKETLGYWSDAKDYATWELTVTKPGAFTVELLQGCGKGQGGSVVEVELGGKKLAHTVKDTGGWQAFEAIEVPGEVRIDKAGRHTLTVRAKSKKGVAVMDLREVRLKASSTR